MPTGKENKAGFAGQEEKDKSKPYSSYDSLTDHHNNYWGYLLVGIPITY